MTGNENSPDAAGGRHPVNRLPKHWYLAIVYFNVVLYSICWMAQVCGAAGPYLFRPSVPGGCLQYTCSDLSL